MSFKMNDKVFYMHNNQELVGTVVGTNNPDEYIVLLTDPLDSGDLAVTAWAMHLKPFKEKSSAQNIVIHKLNEYIKNNSGNFFAKKAWPYFVVCQLGYATPPDENEISNIVVNLINEVKEIILNDWKEEKFPSFGFLASQTSTILVTVSWNEDCTVFVNVHLIASSDYSTY